jgi:cyanophycinase
MRTFLIGGGRDSVDAHAAYVAAAGGPVVAYALDTGTADLDAWRATLDALGVPLARLVPVSADRPPDPSDLHGAAGVYVAGGLTPAYRDAMAGATGWLDAARAAGLVYAGFSAGAQIAPARALVGGWRADVRGRTVAVCDADFGEGLDALAVRPGLGLVPFLVDVHAAQWGMLNRLLHALDAAGVPEGWAVDEGTALEVRDGTLTVHGTGAATRARRTADGYAVTVHLAGDTLTP